VKYEVHSHGYGRKRVQRGGAAGLLDFPGHLWLNLTMRPIELPRAVALADAQPCHAVVMVAGTNQKVHDNGRKPCVPTGWEPA
jgi:hypothetical protein